MEDASGRPKHLPCLLQRQTQQNQPQKPRTALAKPDKDDFSFFRSRGQSRAELNSVVIHFAFLMYQSTVFDDPVARSVLGMNPRALSFDTSGHRRSVLPRCKRPGTIRISRPKQRAVISASLPIVISWDVPNDRYSDALPFDDFGRSLHKIIDVYEAFVSSPLP